MVGAGQFCRFPNWSRIGNQPVSHLRRRALLADSPEDVGPRGWERDLDFTLLFPKG